MEFTEEFIKENELNEKQIEAVKSFTESQIAELKKQWDGKANADAEAILDGALKSVIDLTGIQREKGQKVKDYVQVSAEKYVEGSLAAAKSAMDKKMKELQESAGDVVVKAEYEDLREKYKELQKKEAEYERVKEYETKYKELNGKYQAESVRNAFISVKPVFSDSVNKYEANAKWDEFVNDVKSKYDIKFDDKGIAIAVDKENEYKTSKLSELVEKNEQVQSLSTGRVVKGLGHKPATTTVDGVPFKVNPTATSAERQREIKDYLLNVRKLSVISDEYASEYAKYNTILLQQTAK